MSDIYLAGSYSDREVLLPIFDQLLSNGMTVSATWLFGRHEGKGNQLPARHDLEEIEACRGFVLDCTGSNSTTGGKWTEFGYALALGKHCVVVGKGYKNIFLSLPCVHEFKSWDECLYHIKDVVGHTSLERRER